MIEEYQGASHRLLCEFKDSDGVVIDPAAGALSDIRVYVVHRTSFEVVAKYSKVSTTGFTQFEVVEEPTNGDYKACCYLDASLTQNAQQGMYEIQFELDSPNDNFENGVQTFRMNGILMNLNPAVNG